MRGVFLAMLLGLAAPQSASVPNLESVTIARPAVLAEIDTAKAGGDPVGLAWSTGGTIYLRIQGKEKTRLYVLVTSPSISVSQYDEMPEWAGTYWTWKSGLTAPGDSSLTIEVEQHRERVKSANVVSAGDIAGMSTVLPDSGGGGEGVPVSVAVAAANSSVMADVITMRLKGQVVAEWINEKPLPGMRFGWSPAPAQVLAYVDDKGRLALIDSRARKASVPNTANVLLPAWSTDGKELVFLQRQTRGPIF
jgi:hypothetical protein